MSKKFNENKCCIEIAKHWFREFDKYEEEYHPSSKITINSIRYEKEFPNYYDVEVGGLDEDWCVRFEVYFREYNFKKKKYIFDTYCFVNYLPLAVKVEFSRTDRLFKVKVSYKCDLDDNGVPTNIDYNPEYMNGAPYFLSDIIRLIGEKPLVAIYLNNRVDDDCITHYMEFHNEREMTKIAKKWIKENNNYSKKRRINEKKIADHAVKLFQEELDNNTRTNYWRSGYYPENSDFDWSGIENAHVEMIDCGENSASRYEIYIVSDTLCRQAVEELNEPYEKVRRRLTHRMDDERWEEQEKFENKIENRYHDYGIGGYMWANVVDEDTFKELVELNNELMQKEYLTDDLEWRNNNY